MGKIKKIGELKKIVGGLKRKGKRVVFTNGCFDILHYGHIKYLEGCRRLGDVLVVGLNSDSSTRKIKGKNRPIVGEEERGALLSALEFVDYVIVFAEGTPAKLIKAITPDILAKGGDWPKKNIVGREQVEKQGGRVVTIPFVKGYSTTRIIRRIKNA